MEKQPSLLPIHTGPKAANQQATCQPAHQWPNLERALWDLWKLLHNVIIFALAVIGALTLILASTPNGRLFIMMLIRSFKSNEFESIAAEADWRSIAQASENRRQRMEGIELEKRDGYEPLEKFDWGKLAVNIPLWISEVKFGG